MRMNTHGALEVRKRLYGAQVMAFIAKLPPALLGSDASSLWRPQGHTR